MSLLSPLAVETCCALAVRNCRIEQIVGRIVELPGERRVFYRYAPHGKWFGLDTRILWHLMRDWAVDEIHFVGEKLFSLPKKKFWAESAFDSGRQMFHVPVKVWEYGVPWYEPNMARSTVYAAEPVPFPPPDKVCLADRDFGPNYGKPHLAVPGMYDGSPRNSCAFCGRWLEPEAEDHGRSGEKLSG